MSGWERFERVTEMGGWECIKTSDMHYKLIAHLLVAQTTKTFHKYKHALNDLQNSKKSGWERFERVAEMSDWECTKNEWYAL